MNRSDSAVGTYLDDLARMLADLDPAERDDVLAGVREHVDGILAERPDDPRALEDALLRLGPPEQVAAEARADRAPSTSPSAGAPLPGRAWLVAALALTLTSTLPFTLGTALFRSSVIADVTWLQPMTPLLSTWEAMTRVWPLWVGAVICTVAARRLAPRFWRLLLATGPVCYASAAAGTLWGMPSSMRMLVSFVLLLAVTAGTVAVAIGAYREQPTR
jgi:hypothetical protein